MYKTLLVGGGDGSRPPLEYNAHSSAGKRDDSLRTVSGQISKASSLALPSLERL